MKRILALITAVVLMVSFCAVTASAAKYGRDPYESHVTAKGNYVYYFSDNKICRLHITDGKQKTICEVIGEDPYSLCVMGNYLYYAASYNADDPNASYYLYDAVYKVDIKSGKQTKFFDCKDEEDRAWIRGVITSGNRVYISVGSFVHEEVNDDYYVYIYDTDGKYLGDFTPCIENYSLFIDASNCEVCAAASERKILFTYDEDGDPDDWYSEYTNVYNIVKIKSDLSEERITIPTKIGKDVSGLVYCGKKYIYYTDINDRLCRYNTETEKIRVLAECGDRPLSLRYKNGAIYFFTDKGDVKKYEKGKVSTVKKLPDTERNSAAAYFFDDYILYYVHDHELGGQSYSIIYYSGKKTISVDLAKKT